MRRETFSVLGMGILLAGSQLIAVGIAPLLPLFFLLVWVNDGLFNSEFGGNRATLLAFILAGLLIGLLVKVPEWYVVDTIGFATAAGGTAIMGISFSILPAPILLVPLAAYDAGAVYRTKHMVTLADELTSQKLPVLLVVPKHRGYKFSEQKSLKAQIAEGEEREAMFIGLGDLIIPGIMAVSARAFLTDDVGLRVGAVPPSAIVALAAIAGTSSGSRSSCGS